MRSAYWDTSVGHKLRAFINAVLGNMWSRVSLDADRGNGVPALETVGEAWRLIAYRARAQHHG